MQSKVLGETINEPVLIQIAINRDQILEKIAKPFAWPKLQINIITRVVK